MVKFTLVTFHNSRSSDRKREKWISRKSTEQISSKARNTLQTRLLAMANIRDVFLRLRSTDQKYISIMSCPRGSFGNLAKKEFVLMLRFILRV